MASVRLSVSSGIEETDIFTLTYKGVACDAASVHFGPTVRTRTDILFCFSFSFIVSLRMAKNGLYNLPVLKEADILSTSFNVWSSLLSRWTVDYSNFNNITFTIATFW